MANLIGTNGDDTLVGSSDTNTINGLAGNDTITLSLNGNNTLTGGGGNDKFYDNNYYSTDIITDFGGIGKGVNPSAAVIAEVDTLIFPGGYADDLLLTQNGNNLKITFDEVPDARVILQNFALENLDNLSKSTGATVDFGNILFYGQTSSTDSFDVFNANSTQSTVFNKNTVTFLNNLDNNVNGFDNSDDVINGQGGNDTLDGLSGNDLLRGGFGNDTLIGGAGNDTLDGDTDNNLLSGGDGNDSLFAGGFYDEYRGIIGFGDPISGNNTLNAGAGNDYLNANYTTGNNTLNGGIGDDNLSAVYSTGNNLLSGGAGDDALSISGFHDDFYGSFSRIYGSGNNTLNGDAGNDTLNGSYTTGNNTLNGGAGDDYLRAENSEGNNLLFGGNGNDSLYVSTLSPNIKTSDPAPSSLVTQTVDGGKGDDLLSVDYRDSATQGIATTYNTTTNIGAITAGTYRVSYKNIEELNILGTSYNDNIVGSNGNDTLDPGISGNDTIDGGKGEDLLSVVYSYSATQGIATTFNATTNIGSVTLGKNRVSYNNIERLNILGTSYNDTIVGSNGNDTLSTGDGGNDTIDGGKGDDLLSVDYSYSATQGIATTFNATTNIGSITVGKNRFSYKNIERLNISGTSYNDNIVGNDGNDTLSTGIGGNDTIDGGKGDDLLSVDCRNANAGMATTFNTTTNIGAITAGTNRVSYKNIERLDILGTAYDDNIVGNNGNDTLDGGFGGNDTIIGGAGNDTLRASSSSGNKTLNGGAGDDNLNISYSGGDNLLSGGDGNDSLSISGAGGYAQDIYSGSYGYGEGTSFASGNNTLNGGAGDDNLNADFLSGNNLLSGGDGNDYVSASGYGYYGHGNYYTASGNNTLNGGAGADNLIVDYSSGKNLLSGGDGNDTLSAYNALNNNTLDGGDGNDILIGGKGNDSLYGGTGTDTFAFNSYNEGIDSIYDFNANNELIQISAAGFGGGLSTPSLSASQFTLGTSATTSNQRFIYDLSTGALYFDQDGSASGFSQVKLAQLSSGVSLTKNNFVVV